MSYIPSILLDRNQLKQALLNILKNSIESMPHGGNIYVSTFLRGDRVEITIKDEGVGIPHDKLYRIFEPYFTTKEKGSGLGLMITYRIIKAHGGDIKMKSTKGKGTEVTVILPLKRGRVPLPARLLAGKSNRSFRDLPKRG